MLVCMQSCQHTVYTYIYMIENTACMCEYICHGAVTANSCVYLKSVLEVVPECVLQIVCFHPRFRLDVCGVFMCGVHVHIYENARVP